MCEDVVAEESKVASHRAGVACRQRRSEGKDEFSVRCVQLEVSEILVEILRRRWDESVELERNVRLNT